MLNRVERIPVLNGNFDVKRLDHESIVALAELIVVENNTPSFVSWEKFELGSFSNLRWCTESEQAIHTSKLDLLYNINYN